MDKLIQSLSSLEQDVLVELWELDLRPLGGERLRFCNQVNELGSDVVWQGQAYTRYPILGDGFELSNEGASSRPKLTVSNLLGLATAATTQYNQMLGAKVIRRQTLAKFLDATNFINGNANADPTQERVSQFLIERVASLDNTTAVFELASPAESDNSVVPARIMLADVCCWTYRGEGCGYTGRPVADENDNRTDDPMKDKCSRRILGCRARYGVTAVLPFGGYPSADKVK